MATPCWTTGTNRILLIGGMLYMHLGHGSHGGKDVEDPMAQPFGELRH